MLPLEKCKYYMDRGSELTDYYCPSGFRFLINTDWIDQDRCVEQCAVDLIQSCWKFYESVAVGPAFAYNGSIMHDMIAVYVKKVGISVSCHSCGEFFESKDIVPVETYFRKGKRLCKNCFNVYNYEEIVVGNEIVLVDKYRH